jgi:hypothetical protein
MVDAGFLMEDMAFPPPPRNPVSLNRLRVLEIGKWPSLWAIRHFLSSLVHPRQVDLRIWGFEFLKKLSLDSLFPPQSILFSGLTKICATYPVDMYDGYDIISLKDSELVLVGGFTQRACFETITLFSLESVRELVLGLSAHQANSPTVEDWRRLLHSMPSLSSLTILPHDTRTILFALNSLPPSISHIETITLYIQKPYLDLSRTEISPLVQMISQDDRQLRRFRVVGKAMPWSEVDKQEWKSVEFVHDMNLTELRTTIKGIVKGVWPTPGSLVVS